MNIVLRNSSVFLKNFLKNFKGVDLTLVLLHGISTPQDPHAMQEQSAVNLQGFALHVISTLQDKTHKRVTLLFGSRWCVSLSYGNSDRNRHQ